MKTNIRGTAQDRVFDVANCLLLFVILLLVLYPLYFIVIASISDPNAIYAGRVLLLPQDVTFEGYRTILEDDRIWTGYGNTILYALVGTSISVAVTICGAFALSRPVMPGRRVFMLLVIFTMFFSGGLIPLYLLVQQLHLDNSMWALILPVTVYPWNLIVARTFFLRSLPEEMYEAATLDGCSDFKLLTRIAIPLSKPIIAVMVLYYAVGLWNSYFPAMIYLRDEAKYPLQLILRNMLIENDMSSQVMASEALIAQQRIADLMKYGVIIVSSVPVLVLYPFVEKHFAKGVTLGAVKG